MAVTQADVDALRVQAAQGITRVRFADGREVTYASIAEMLAAAGQLEQQVAGATFQRSSTTSFQRD